MADTENTKEAPVAVVATPAKTIERKVTTRDPTRGPRLIEPETVEEFKTSNGNSFKVETR